MDYFSTFKFIKKLKNWLKIFGTPFKNSNTQITHLKYIGNFFKQLHVFYKKKNVEGTN